MSTAGYDEKTFVPSQDPNKKGFSDGVHVSKSTSPYDPDAAEAKTLHRGLNSRQISMIAIGGAIGTGLIIGSGTALQRGGPLGMLLAYAIMGMVCFLVMAGLGEMATYIPHRKGRRCGFSGYASRFVDPALGVATGYNYLFKYLIVTPNNVVVSSIVLGYWSGGASVPIAAWLCVFLAAILVINFLGVRFFGEFEFWFSLIKVITLIGLLLMSIILTSGGNPQKDVIWFEYWQNPGPFASYKVDGSKGAFLGVWACFVNALFAYMGTELIGVTVGECANPRRAIPSAIKKTFWRILIFYVGGVFCIGLLVASNDPGLFVANKASTSAAASPFVVAVRRMGIDVLPGFLNGCILCFTLSAANSDLYIASRTLFALAEEGHCFSFFTRVNRLGVPYYALLCTFAFCFLSFLRVSSDGAKVFGWFVNLVAMFGGLTWMSISLCHIRFVKACQAQGIDRSQFRYRAPFGIAGSYVALVVTGIVCIFKGWDSFVPTFDIAGFFTNYVGFVSFAVSYFGYKLVYKTKLIPLREIDFVTGKQEIDDEEQYWLDKAAARGPLTFWQRLGERFI